MTLRIAVVHEAEADFHTATQLADRFLMEAIEWLDEQTIPYLREWIGTIPVEQRLTWKAIPRLAREIGIKAHGHINGEPLEADAGAARRAILYLIAALDGLEAIHLVRDQDDQPERRNGLEQARAGDKSNMAIVLGLAVVEREAWIHSGFEPQDADEQARLEDERQTLGFNPHEQSHKLTACKDDNASRSPKRVLRALTNGDRYRERRCWAETPLDRLRECGNENGLALYLDEVRTHLAPLIGHVKRGAES